MSIVTRQDQIRRIESCWLRYDALQKLHQCACMMQDSAKEKEYREELHQLLDQMLDISIEVHKP